MAKYYTVGWLPRLSEGELKLYWRTGDPKSIGYSCVRPSNCQSSYTFGKGKKNSPYAKVLNYLYIIPSASKYNILEKVFNLNNEQIKADIAGRWPNLSGRDKKYPLRGEKSTLFSAMHEARLIEYSKKTKEWSITDLGKWYVENILGD